MIILTMRTDKPESEIGLYEDGNQICYETWEAHRQLAETLHKKIKELLKAENKTLHDIGGVIAFEGPGSFTGLRIGISIANALAHGLDVPIVGTQGLDWIAEGAKDLMAGKNKIPVVPFYGSDANITTPKK